MSIFYAQIPLTAVEGLWNGVFGSTIEDFVLQETDLENCDMILKKKMENSAKRDKRKYSDNVFRSPMLGFRMGISSNAGSGFGSNVSSQNPHNNPSYFFCKLLLISVLYLIILLILVLMMVFR